MAQETPKNLQIDEKDLAILGILQEDARTPFLEIARKTGLSNATIHERVTRMRENGVIRGFKTDIDEKKLGYGVLALIGLTLAHPVDNLEKFNRQIAKIPGVLQVYHVTGESDTILVARARSIDELKELLVENIQHLATITRINTMIVLDNPVNRFNILQLK